MIEVSVLLAVLAASTAFGLYRRVVDGRMRPVAQPDASSDRADRAAAQGAGLDGPGAPADPEPAGPELSPGDLGRALGERATLVQFSSAFCQPCRATRVVLGEVAAMVPGVVHVEVDAESHLDLVRRLDVTRTPTVLVLDPAGRVRTRATGTPRRADVIAALGRID